MAAVSHVAAQAAAPAPMSVFERYLSVWVMLCIVAGIAFGQLLPAPVRAIGRMEVAQVNLPVGLLIWVMIIPMLLKVDFGALHRGEDALARHRHHAVRQLGGEALFDGAARLDLHPPRVRAVPAGRADRQLHRRPDPARRRSLHGDGVRVEPPEQRRSPVHAVAGGVERHHHGVRLRARSSRCCWACRRSLCPGTRCSRRSSCTS